MAEQQRYGSVGSGKVRAWTGVIALAAAVVVVSAACGDSSAGSSAASTTTADSTTAAAAAQGGGAPEAVTIESTEWAYAISGSPHAGLVEIRFSNAGESSHEVGLVRLKDGVTLAQVKAALGKGEAAAKALQAEPGKEIAGAAIVGPHVSEHVVVPLKAGHYVVTSFLPMAGGKTQVEKGMIGEFTVLDASSSAPVPPATQGSVTLTDHGITVPSDFSKGGTFAVENTGTKTHDFSVAKLDDGSLPDYFQCVSQSFGKGSSIDDCPGSLQGGVTALEPGESAYITVAYGPGKFGYVSTQGDGADFQAGLHGTFSNP